jgi:hypothetical protein
VAYTTDNAVAELKRLTRWRTERILEIGAEGEPDSIHGSLLLAIASRETNLRNIVGGGFFRNDGEWEETGVDRGLFQINQQYHGQWLNSVPGCDSGKYEEIHPSALPQGRVPGLTRGARKCRDLLRDRITYMKNNGVPEGDRLRCAVAAYNGGSWGALKGYMDEGDPDTYTTGGNYSKDCLARQVSIRRAVKRLGWG